MKLHQYLALISDGPRKDGDYNIDPDVANDILPIISPNVWILFNIAWNAGFEKVNGIKNPSERK